MVGKLLVFLKVVFRHGEPLVTFLKDLYDELKKESPENRELSEMEEEMLDAEDYR